MELVGLQHVVIPARQHTDTWSGPMASPSNALSTLACPTMTPHYIYVEATKTPRMCLTMKRKQSKTYTTSQKIRRTRDFGITGHKLQSQTLGSRLKFPRVIDPSTSPCGRMQLFFCVYTSPLHFQSIVSERLITMQMG